MEASSMNRENLVVCVFSCQSQPLSFRTLRHRTKHRRKRPSIDTQKTEQHNDIYRRTTDLLLKTTQKKIANLISFSTLHKD
jgi:hypothetical protein